MNNNHFNTFQPLISYGQGPLTRRCRTRVKVNTLLKGTNSSWTNPLALPPAKWYEFYKRIRLFPWWITYNAGIAEEAILRKKIIEQGCTMGLQVKWMQRIIRHAVSEFSKKGFGIDYYGYHNITHELEATYISLLAAKGQTNNNKHIRLTKKDVIYLFTAALFMTMILKRNLTSLMKTMSSHSSEMITKSENLCGHSK